MAAFGHCLYESCDVAAVDAPRLQCPGPLATTWKRKASENGTVSDRSKIEPCPYGAHRAEPLDRKDRDRDVAAGTI